MINYNRFNMSRRDDIKKQIKKQDNENYGEETISGSSHDPESDDDTAKALEEAVGTDIKQGQEFSLKDEVEKDERARRTKPKI